MSTTISCRLCRLYAVCDGPTAQAATPAIGLFKKIIRLDPKKMLVDSMGKPLKGFYVLRTGCVKFSRMDAYGKEHINWFYLPGDLVGLEYLSDAFQDTHMIAVIQSELCEISVQALYHTLGTHQQFRMDFLQWMGARIQHKENFANYTAEQRVAYFLLMMFERMSVNNGDICVFPFGRDCIGSYLGLASETVSRIFRVFQDSHLVLIKARQFQLLNAQALRQLII